MSGNIESHQLFEYQFLILLVAMLLTTYRRSHMMDRLHPIAAEVSPTQGWNMELLYIVLVLTIVDPSFTQREMTQDACAGTLVAKHLVITSASCLIHTSQEHPDPQETMVYFRTNVNAKATKIYIHPGFTKAEEDYNVAAIEVEGNHQIKKFPKLPSKSLNFESINSNCKLAGYGKIAKFERSSFHAVQMNSSMVVEFECRIKSDHRFCLHFHNLLPCNGDVGSPIICDDDFYAIFSPNTVIYPQVCMERYGTTFVKVYAVKDWIERIISVPQLSLEWMNNPLYILLLCGTVLAVIGGIYYLIMEWLQKTFEPLTTETAGDGEGDDDINSDWNNH